MIIYVLLYGYKYEFDCLEGVHTTLKEAQENFIEGDHAEITKFKLINDKWTYIDSMNTNKGEPWPEEEM